MLKHSGTKIIETERFILRPFKTDDAKNMYDNWASDPMVTEYLTWKAHENVLITQMIVDMWVNESKNEDNYNWAIVLKDINEPIGNISVVQINENDNSAIIGYCMGRKWWGKGIMPEVFNSVIDYLFNETGIEKIVATHHIENPKSGRVMQKVGMKYVGTGKGTDNNGKEIDVACYVINKTDLRISIKHSNKSHIDGICNLLHQVCNVHHKGRPDLFRKDGIKYNALQLENMVMDTVNPIFVAVDKAENVLGYAFCVTKEHKNDGAIMDIKTLYIDDLCVDENVRGGNIGGRLYQYVKSYAKENGYYNLTLNVWACNPEAEAFYKKCGLSVQKTSMEQIL